MSYKKGDIVLIKFPFTDLSNAKKRPVLIIKDENRLNDFVCFQITSKSTQEALYPIFDRWRAKACLICKI
jgi:mRNA interferase MazF